jgi:hypothetical protein
MISQRTRPSPTPDIALFSFTTLHVHVAVSHLRRLLMQALRHPDAWHSFSSFRPHAVHPPPSLQPLRHGREWRGQAMEATMQVWTTTELLHMTREQLCELMCDLEYLFKQLEAGTAARGNALTTLDNIRRVMLRKGFHP